MTEQERQEIRAAARKAATESRRAQGLPEKISDPEAVAQIVALLRQPAAERKAA